MYPYELNTAINNATILSELSQWATVFMGLAAIVAIFRSVEASHKELRLQPSKVFAEWLELEESKPLRATVINNSDAPVKDIRVSFRSGFRPLPLLMPSEESEIVILGIWNWGPTLEGPSIDLHFTDGIGNRWKRTGASPPRRVRLWRPLSAIRRLLSTIKGIGRP